MNWVEEPIRTFHLMHMENSFKKGKVNPQEEAKPRDRFLFESTTLN